MSWRSLSIIHTRKVLGSLKSREVTMGDDNFLVVIIDVIELVAELVLAVSI